MRKQLQDLPPHGKGKTAGELRHRITLQVPTEVADSAGQPIPAWPDHSTVWGLWEPTGGHEEVDGEQTRSIISGMVTVRANTNFTPKCRVKVNGLGVRDLILNIGAVHPPDPDTGLQLMIVRQPDVVQ